MVSTPNTFGMVQCHPLLARQPSSGLVASNSGRSGATEVSGQLFQRRSVHRCRAGGSAATPLAAIPTKCRQQVARLEEALKVLGEGDSTEVRGLQAALKEARRVAQNRPVAAQIEECEAFIHRSRKRLDRLEEERLKEQQDLDAALAGIARLREEMARAVPVTVPPVGSDSTQPARIPDLVAEFDRLRARVREMEVEREEARKKRSRSLSVPSPDLVAGPDVTLQEWDALHDHHVGQDKGAIMETLIQRGSSMVTNSNRFSPLA